MPPCFHTPRTVLTWATLEEWLAGARRIERRRASALRNLQAELHIRTLPVSVVYQCSSRATLPHAIDCSGAAPPIFASRRAASGRMRRKPP